MEERTKRKKERVITLAITWENGTSLKNKSREEREYYFGIFQH